MFDDPLGIREFPEAVMTLYRMLLANITKPRELFTPPDWVEGFYENSSGLAMWLSGLAVIFALLFVILLFGKYSDNVLKAIGGALILSVAVSLIGYIAIVELPDVMASLMDGLIEANPVAIEEYQPDDGTLFHILVVYSQSNLLGFFLLGTIMLLPYMTWLALCGLVMGIALWWCGVVGARLIRFSIYAILSCSLIGLPVMYLLYVTAVGLGNNGGVVTSAGGMALMILAILFPFLAIGGASVTDVVINKGSTNALVDGAVDAAIDNVIDTNTTVNDSIDTHNSIDLDVQSEVSTGGDDTKAVSSSTETEANPVIAPAATEQPDAAPSKLDDTLDKAAIGATLAGHPEVTMVIQTAKSQFQNTYPEEEDDDTK